MAENLDKEIDNPPAAAMTTTFTSFSNPNYRLEDRINSNDILSPDYEGTNFYDSINLQSPTENVRDTNGSARTRRKKYGEIDLVSMGLCDDVTPVDSPYNSSSEPSTLQSPSSDERDSLSGQDDVVNGESEGGINCFTDTELVICDDDVYEDVGPDVIPKSRHKNTNTSNTVTESKTLTESSKSSRGFLGYYSMLEAKAREFSVRNTMESPASDDHTDYEEEETTPSSSTSKQERFDDALYISSPDSNDSGIQSDARSDDGGPTHLRGPLTDDIYTVVNRPRKEKNPLDDEQQELERSKRHSTIPAVQSLPSGWEKCDDEEGAYYWHIKSGTIQREPPSPSHVITAKRSISLTSGINTAASSLLSPVSSAAPTEPQSLTAEEHLQEFQGHALQYAAKSLQSLQSAGTKEAAPPKFSDNEHDFEQPIRFAVRSLGWVRVAEEDLTPERSSKAVNKCIVDLSLGRNDINDVVGRWGDGKDLFMDLDRYSLSLIDPHDEAVLNTQTIHSVRVWGVGRDNGRDFAYVARDKTTRRHMCHVFRCDTPARNIANLLRDICKKIMLERRIQQAGTAQRSSRPTDLPNLDKSGPPNGQKISLQTISFPTPMEEPKKVIRCHYLGVEDVTKPTGMHILNSAIERIYTRVPPEKWTFASVSVAPSRITITEHSNSENVLAECRVRFLSLMGIAMKNVKLCAFIIHSTEEQFQAHVFHCEPSAGPLCKTIEAACKLRYQKCLDAHPHKEEQLQQQPTTPKQPATTAQDFTTVVNNLKSEVQKGVQKSMQNVFTLLKNSRKTESS